MSDTTPNLSLIRWNTTTDLYSTTELNANWDAIDAVPDNIRKIKILSALPDGVTEPLYPGRLAICTTVQNGVPPYTLMRYDGANWHVVGPIEQLSAVPYTGLVTGRLVLLTAQSGSFPAYTLIMYTSSSGWAALGMMTIQKAGGTTLLRPQINVIDGLGIQTTVADNPTQNRVDLTVGMSYQPTQDVFRNFNQTIYNFGSDPVTWLLGTGDFFSINAPTFLTVPAGLGGLYLISAQATFSGASSIGNRHLHLYVQVPPSSNLYEIAKDSRPAIGGGIMTQLSVSTVWRLSSGDQISVVPSQDSGSVLDLVALNDAHGTYTPRLTVTRLGNAYFE